MEFMTKSGFSDSKISEIFVMLLVSVFENIFEFFEFDLIAPYTSWVFDNSLNSEWPSIPVVPKIKIFTISLVIFGSLLHEYN